MNKDFRAGFEKAAGLADLAVKGIGAVGKSIVSNPFGALNKYQAVGEGVNAFKNAKNIAGAGSKALNIGSNFTKGGYRP